MLVLDLIKPVLDQLQPERELGLLKAPEHLGSVDESIEIDRQYFFRFALKRLYLLFDTPNLRVHEIEHLLRTERLDGLEVLEILDELAQAHVRNVPALLLQEFSQQLVLHFQVVEPMRFLDVFQLQT